MNRRILQFIVISVVILICCAKQEARAQYYSEPIYSDGYADALDWSPDSRYLYFATHSISGALADCSCWYQFDIQSWTLASNYLWPRQPHLSTEEIAAFYPPLYDDQSWRPFFYTSPNGRYMVYAPHDDPQSFRLGDRQTLTYFNLHIPVYSNYFSQPSDVIWSANSTAFILVRQSYDTVGYYVGHIKPGARSLLIRKFSFGSGMNSTRNEHFFVPEKFYDISQDGDIFIASGEDTWWVADYTESLPIFAIQSVVNPADNYFLKFEPYGDVITARLVIGKPRRMLVLTESAILQYELDTKVLTPLNINTYNAISKLLNNFEIEDARFSPDGQWLAFARGNWLYVISLLEAF